jgi:hypothetical protein
MTINWIDDQAAMAIADSMGVAHSTQIIAVADIDIKLSAQNRARDIPLDESRRDAICHAFQSGIPMPKIFVRAIGAKLVIAGGNHRFSGLPAGTRSIPVHVTTCTDAEFEVLCRALNTVVGIGMTQQERLRSAADAVDRMKMTQKDAAAVYGIKVSSLEKHLKQSRCERRLASLLPGAKNKMTQTHFARLAELANNDNILKAAAEFVDKAKATADNVGELVAVARTRGTEAEQVQVFCEAAKPFTRGKSVNVPKRVRQTLIKVLTQIESLEGKTTWQQLELDPVEVATVTARIAKATNILDCLCKENG